MMLMTKTEKTKLIANGIKAKADPEFRCKPVVKLFGGQCTWLVAWIDADDSDRLFVLADLGFGSPEMGDASLREISALRFQFGLPVERDRWFTATKLLGEYADDARRAGAIRV